MGWAFWRREPVLEEPPEWEVALSEFYEKHLRPRPEKHRAYWVLKYKGQDWGEDQDEDEPEKKPAGPKTVYGKLPGEPGRQHHVKGIYASYKVRHTGLLTLLENGLVIGCWYCHTERDLPFSDEGIVLNPGAEMGVCLGKGEAPPAKLVGALTVVGYTEDVLDE